MRKSANYLDNINKSMNLFHTSLAEIIFSSGFSLAKLLILITNNASHILKKYSFNILVQCLSMLSLE